MQSLWRWCSFDVAVADDVAAARSHADGDAVLQPAGLPKEIPLRILSEPDLDVSIPKCYNFLIEKTAERMRQIH